MNTRIAVYRIPLDDPRAFSLRGDGKHPRDAGFEEHLCLEREFDEAGRETLVVQRGPGGDVRYRKATRWEAGRRAAEEEFFAETGATVTREILREGDTETEHVRFDGELDSTIERKLLADGTVASERVLDASGEIASLTERDAAGRVVRQVDPRSEQRFRYDPSGELAEFVSTVNGQETVETTVFEDGRPAGAVISSSGEEIGRRTIAWEGRRRTEEETRAGRVVLRRIEDLDAEGRLLNLEETSMRRDGSLLESRRAQEWSAEGRLLQSLAEAWLSVPGAGRMKAQAGRREMTYDGEGRTAEILLENWQDEELEDNSYYRFDHERGA